MRIKIPEKFILDMGLALNGVGNAVKYLIKDKRVQAGLISLPIIGWTGSEYKRYKENSEHEKQIVLFREALRKHQAIIDTLENDKKREAYKQQLWEALIGKKEGV